MKTLILIIGPNGVGKSTTCELLHRRLPRSSWLDSDWCRLVNPFEFTPEIESLIANNMSALLGNYLQCSQVDYVIFSYGFHGPRKRIFEEVLRNLSAIEFRLLTIMLFCSEEENTRRMMKDWREPERIRRGLETRLQYQNTDNPRIETTHLSVEGTVEEILGILQ